MRRTLSRLRDSADDPKPTTDAKDEGLAPKRAVRSRWVVHPVTIAAVLTVACLPLGAPVPDSSVDGSYQLALSLAHLHGIAAGSGFVFTYGPLGFLSYPDIVWLPGALFGLIYVAATAFSFYYFVYRGLLEWLPSIAAIVLTAAFAVFAVQAYSLAEVATAALILWSLTLVRPEELHRALPSWVPAMLGGAAALQLLVKFTPGGEALVVAFVVAVARPPRLKNVARCTSSFLLSLVALWLASQQSLANITSWFRGSLQIAVGYSSAMARYAGFAGTRFWLFQFAVVGVLCLGVWRFARKRWAQAVPFVALVTLAVWFFTKEGFTDGPDGGHTPLNYLCLAVLVVAIPWERRWISVGVVGLVLALSTLVTTPVFYGSDASQVRHLVAAPRHGLENAGKIVRAAVEPSFRSSELNAARQSLDAFYKLPNTIAIGLRLSDVHADPWAIAAVWAYDLPWRPVPVFQTYTAYTPYLDRLNADSLQGGRGPDAVIRQQNPFLSPVGRIPAWESPDYMVTLTCNYEMTADTPGWQVLERTSNACGRYEPMSQEVLQAGKALRVPTPQNPHDIIVATFDYPTSPIERVATLLLKPFRLPTVLTDGTTSAFVTGTASQFHLIHVPDAIGTRHITNAGLDIRSLSFPNAEGAVAVRFYELSTA